MEDVEQIEDFKICRIRGLDLILKSINCEKYKSLFENYGINEHTMLHLTQNDLKYMNVDDEDINLILTAINVLNKTLNLSELRLSNDEILKMQSIICGQLGSIALVLNHLYYLIVNNKNHVEDLLIDNYLSSIDAALMINPYMKSEEKQVEKSLKSVFKLKQRRGTMIITTTVCTILLFSFGFVLRRSNYSSLMHLHEKYLKLIS